MNKTTNIIEIIKQHQDTATKAVTFGELGEIFKAEGEVIEKLALAFTLGYMRGSESVKEAKANE